MGLSGKASIRGEGRDRLIRAAAECFTVGGGAAMSIKDICSHSGASVGTVYHHFPAGLPDLEAALYLETLAGYQGSFLDELQRHRSAAAGVKSIVGFHLEWMAGNVQRAHYLMYFSADWLSGRHLTVLDQMNLHFASTAAAWREPFVVSGHIRSLPSYVYGAIILGPAQQFASGVISRRGGEGSSDAIRSAAPILADAAWIAVKGNRG